MLEGRKVQRFFFALGSEISFIDKKVFVSGKLSLIKEDAKLALTARLQKEKDLEKRRLDISFMKMWRMGRDDMHVKGVAARKAEKEEDLEILMNTS